MNDIKIHVSKKIRKEDKELYKILNSFIKEKLKDSSDYYYNIGYETLGPLLYGYNKWLNSKIKENEIKKIFFLARDGKIIQKSYKIMYKEEFKYIYASRRALSVPMIWKCNTFDEIKNIIHFQRKISVKTFFEQVGLDYLEYEEIANKLRIYS